MTDSVLNVTYYIEEFYNNNNKKKPTYKYFIKKYLHFSIVSVKIVLQIQENCRLNAV